jgi:tRNA 5-methylaminomethyl-2-thiouridine biosynthesis bifunctional protein
MPTNTSDLYDVAVIGAGIAGVSAAWHLREAGLRVVLIDRSSVPASGGSGAAGAFVAPKIGKGGPLQQLTNEAFEYAHRFYRHFFPEYFEESGVVRIPRDDDDAAKFPIYEQHNTSRCERWDHQGLAEHGIGDPNGGLFFPDAGDCDAPGLCRAMAEGVDFVQGEVGRIEPCRARMIVHKPPGSWQIHFKTSNGALANAPCLAQNVVLATGYQNDLFDMRYMGIKGLWGSRGDYRTSAKLPVSLHKTLSVSSSRNGIVKIGATHVKHSQPCMVCDGQPLVGLFAGASELVDTLGFVLKETFCGMRSGSRDYFPVAGSVIDVKYVLEHYPAITRGAKPPLKYLPNLFVLNGLGGRGFVLAPLVAKWLTQNITTQTIMPDAVQPDRLFWKWVRKEH